jgi:hypothetical protein
MQTQQNSTINVGSKHYINQLESIIIQIARALAIEYQLPVDPDSKEMAREIIQAKANSLLKDKDIEELSKFHKEVVNIIKSSKDQTTKELAIKTFHLFKLLGLDYD